MKKILLFFLFLTLSNADFKEIEFNRGKELIIGDFSREKLLKVIGVDYPPIYKFWKKEPTFQKAQIPKFKKALLEYCHSLGYYKAKIEVKKEKKKIIFNIIKNEPIKIYSIKISPSFKKLIELNIGDTFKTSSFSSSKSKVKRYFQENGYPKAEIEAKAYIDLELYRVEIEYKIDTKERCYFGDTTIKKRANINIELIKRAIKYKKGELFDIKKIEDTYDNLYKYHIFKYIEVEPNIDINSSSIPILINLIEGKNREIKAFIGYSTDEEFRVGTSWEHKNFFGNLKDFKIGFKISGLGYEIYNSFYNPLFPFPILREVSLNNSFKYRNYKYNSYNTKKIEEILTFGKKWKSLEHYFGFLLESNQIVSKIENYQDGNYFINALFYRLMLDRRDSKMNARNGYLASLYFEKSTKIIASEVEYLKSLVEFRAIKSISDYTFAFKSKVGTISGDVPIFKHFFTGGAFTNRGYNYQSVGKKDKNNRPYGGLTLFDLMLESRYHLSKNFSLALFYDSSILNNQTYDFKSQIYKTYGFGVRYLTLIGPLRLDIGFPQNDKNSRYRVNFTIGEAF